MNTDIVQAMHMAEEMKGYADKRLLDVTSNQEPVYDKPMQRIEDYEQFIDSIQPSIEQLNEQGDEYDKQCF